MVPFCLGAVVSVVREKITRVAESWFLMEPLFFAVWTTHHLVENAAIDTVRVGRGRIEYNPAFLDALDKQALAEVMLFEAVRIVLRHPYQRRQDDARTAYLASNLAVQELLRTRLPMPHAVDVFGSHDCDGQSFEFYYHRLRQTPQETSFGGACDAACDGQGESSWGSDSPRHTLADGRAESAPQPGKAGLAAYADAGRCGIDNAEGWDVDDLLDATLTDVVQRIREGNIWGTIGGRLRERILAASRPRLNYRDVLRQFRASILSSRRRLTRMKPNRRYGFLQMGSRHEFCTKLLFAVDVSGSMSSDDLGRGFSVVNQFFRYGVPRIEVIQFDAELKGKATTLTKARREVHALGRGGTNFQPIIDHVDQQRDYDGLIIYTDGIAPAPTPPKNRRTRILWLFVSEDAHAQMAGPLRHVGVSAFLQRGKERAGRDSQ